MNRQKGGAEKMNRPKGGPEKMNRPKGEGPEKKQARVHVFKFLVCGQRGIVHART